MCKSFKKCKGFKGNLCENCKRKDKNAELLVRSLASYPKSDKKYCKFFR